MKLIIITGMSGAGKSSVLKMFEDIGYNCVDNPPIPFILQMPELSRNKKYEKVALGIDIRSGEELEELDEIFDNFKEEGYSYEILFLEASTEVLVKRYKETRRSHPLSPLGMLDVGIEAERERLMFIKNRSHTIIDTSELLVRDLRAQFEKIYLRNEGYNNLNIIVQSFGYKYGFPQGTDMIFDVRFLPNPYYVPELSHKTGNELEVQQFVLDSQVSRDYLDKIKDMVGFVLPHIVDEGRNQFVISIGCTGGKHRSVTLANALYDWLKDTEYGLKIQHRDIGKDAGK